MRTTGLTPRENDQHEQIDPVLQGFELDAEALSRLTIVRRFHLADMCDREAVIQLVAALGSHHAAGWLYAHPHLYFLALRNVEAMLQDAAVARPARGFA